MVAHISEAATEVLPRKARATALMETAAKKVGANNMEDFAQIVAKLLNEKSALQVARELGGVDKSTFVYWLDKLGIEMVRVAVITAKQKIFIVPR